MNKIQGFIDQRVLTENEMNTILESHDFTKREKDKIMTVKLDIKELMKKMNVPRSRLIPMIDNRGEVYVWLD